MDEVSEEADFMGRVRVCHILPIIPEAQVKTSPPVSGFFDFFLGDWRPTDKLLRHH
jgi:hypothetical protein